MSKLRSIATLIIFVSLAFAGKILAASSLELAISPPVTYLSLKPGEKTQHQITLENKSDRELQITPSIADFEPNNINNQIILHEQSNFKYINITDENKSFGQAFLLPAHEQVIVTYELDIPQSALEKEYKLTLLFAAQVNQAEKIASASQVNIAVGSNLILLVSKSNQDEANLTITKISTWSIVDSLMPISFHILAENDGKNASSVRGQVKITSFSGQELANFDFYPDMILAQSSRYLRTKDFISEKFKFKKPFILGIYQIKSDLAGSSSQNKTIIAFPFSFLCLPLLVFIVYYLYRYGKKKI